MTLKLIAGEKAIMKEVKSLKTDQVKMADRVHVVLCSALAHVQEHGNCTVLDHVAQNIHQFLNHRGIGVFIRQFTNLRVDENDAGETIYRKPKAKALEIKMDEAMANPYWTLAASVAGNTQTLFDVEKRFLSLIGQIRKNIQQGKVKDEKAASRVLKVMEDDAKTLKLDLASVPKPGSVNNNAPAPANETARQAA